MPLCKLSPVDIVDALARIEAGELTKDVARDYGVHPGTLSYHRRGGASVQAMGRPWRPYFARCNRLLSAGDYREARLEAMAAVEQIERFVPVAEREAMQPKITTQPSEITS